MDRNRHAFFCLLALLLRACPLFAAETDVSGHVKYQLTGSQHKEDDLAALLGPQGSLSQALDFRLNGRHNSDDIEFAADGEILGIASNNLQARRESLSRAPSGPISAPLLDDDRRLFDLTTLIDDEDDRALVARFDRLYLARRSGDSYYLFGRQAISWGNGLVFSALDLLNPFSPVEIDKDYKSGDDMFYIQRGLESGDDLQVLSVFRRDVEENRFEMDECSFAVKYHTRPESPSLDIDLLSASHYGEPVLGLGLSGEVRQAVWRLDVSAVRIDGGSVKPAIVANIDRSWTASGMNMYGYLEYFVNSLGIDGGDYELLPQALLERVSRGELYTLARHYLAFGLRLEGSPLFNIHPANILNLSDRSGLLQLRLVYDAMQDLSITLGGNVPYGDRQTEFGGLRYTDDVFLGPARELYVRVSCFF